MSKFKFFLSTLFTLGCHLQANASILIEQRTQYLTEKLIKVSTCDASQGHNSVKYNPQDSSWIYTRKTAAMVQKQYDVRTYLVQVMRDINGQVVREEVVLNSFSAITSIKKSEVVMVAFVSLVEDQNILVQGLAQECDNLRSQIVP